MNEFWAKILASALLTLVIKGGVALAGHWIAWWFAGLISLVVVFGGWLVVTGDWDEVFR